MRLYFLGSADACMYEWTVCTFADAPQGTTHFFFGTEAAYDFSPFLSEVELVLMGADWEV